jgi:hypothetical protein
MIDIIRWYDKYHAGKKVRKEDAHDHFRVVAGS